MSPDHHHPPEIERRIRESALDGTLAESFPASDPASTIPNPDLDEVLEEDGEAGINPQLPIPNSQATLSHVGVGSCGIGCRRSRPENQRMAFGETKRMLTPPLSESFVPPCSTLVRLRPRLT
jgi:hypothetical protein